MESLVILIIYVLAVAIYNICEKINNRKNW
jgi:hypothetical protein